MLKFSIKPHKSCVTRTSNSKIFYHQATVPSYFYDGTVARWYFLKKIIFYWVLGFYLGIEFYYFIV